MQTQLCWKPGFPRFEPKRKKREKNWSHWFPKFTDTGIILNFA